MAIYIGEVITVTAQAVDPAHGNAPISDADAKVDFYAVGANPIKNPDDRTVEKGPIPLAWDATIVNADNTTGAYVGYVDTTGWDPGKRVFKVTLSGSYNSWEYSTVKLEA